MSLLRGALALVMTAVSMESATAFTAPLLSQARRSITTTSPCDYRIRSCLHMNAKRHGEASAARTEVGMTALPLYATRHDTVFTVFC